MSALRFVKRLLGVTFLGCYLSVCPYVCVIVTGIHTIKATADVFFKHFSPLINMYRVERLLQPHLSPCPIMYVMSVIHTFQVAGLPRGENPPLLSSREGGRGFIEPQICFIFLSIKSINYNKNVYKAFVYL